MGIQFKDGNYLPIVLDVTSKENTINNLSNFLSATIYPVPIQENRYSINFNAARDLHFIYILSDFNGNAVYKNEYKIAGGTAESVEIKPEMEIPEGVLTNTFIFDDGSQLSYLTIKAQ